jgi:limonene-1,2-epoxide hydrolase
VTDANASIDVVRSFLAALQARDVEAAQRHLAPNARIVVPGGRVVGSVREIVVNSSARYRAIGKDIERFDVVISADKVVVYCLGTLQGTWPDGTAFHGIRFVDRFELRDGRIVLQEVWNDAAEHRARLV